MDEQTRLTKRKCRWCGKTYRAPVWERWAGCKECAPTIEDAVKEVEKELDVESVRR